MFARIMGDSIRMIYVEVDPDENIEQNVVTPISLRGHESNISASHISPDEKFILTFSGEARDNGGAPEKLVRLWSVENLLRDPAAKPVILPLDLSDERFISSLAFSPDSRWVYVIDTTNTLHYFPTSIEDLKEQACAAVGRNFIINEWERFFPEKEYRKTCENLPEHPSAVNQ
jgi:WD40 repeat protein